MGWFALDSIPVLRVSSSFPVTTVWLRQLQLDSVELVGSCILFEAHNPRPKLSIEERASAAYCRARIMEEIDELPVHLETRIEYMNSAAEMMQEVGHVTGWTPGSLNGTHFGGIEQDKSMVNLRDLPLIAHVLDSQQVLRNVCCIVFF